MPKKYIDAAEWQRGLTDPYSKTEYINAIGDQQGKWATGVKNGAANWVAGVSTAEAKARYSNAGNAQTELYYIHEAQTKGADHWSAAGSSATALANYVAGFTPYASLMSTIVGQLPAKGPKGSDANYVRSRQMGQVLHDLSSSAKKDPGGNGTSRIGVPSGGAALTIKVPTKAQKHVAPAGFTPAVSPP